MTNDTTTRDTVRVAGQVDLEEEIEQQAFKLSRWMAHQGIFIFTAALILFAALFIDGFASLPNITDVFNRAAPIGIVAAGMTFVVISGNYLDLSVVAQVATAGVVLIAVSNAVGLPVAILVGVAIALVYGLVNGVAVGVFKANAVIVTLSTTFIGLGLLRWATGGSIYFGPNDGPIRAFGTAKIGPLPLTMLLMRLSRPPPAPMRVSCRVPCLVPMRQHENDGLMTVRSRQPPAPSTQLLPHGSGRAAGDE